MAERGYWGGGISRCSIGCHYVTFYVSYADLMTKAVFMGLLWSESIPQAAAKVIYVFLLRGGGKLYANCRCISGKIFAKV